MTQARKSKNLLRVIAISAIVIVLSASSVDLGVTITPTPIPYPTPTVPIAVQPKVIYIHCVNPIHGTRIAYGVNPVCPHGYVKK
jgi:hypothetical protein